MSAFPVLDIKGCNVASGRTHVTFSAIPAEFELEFEFGILTVDF